MAARELAAEGTDQLTGALRRHVGLAAFNRELERALRHDVPLTLAFVDVDGLKHVNDTYGHDAGDALLRHVVGTIREGLRRYDVITRVGGDEFAVLLPGQDLLGARARFAEINARLAHAEHHPQFSVGFAQWRRGRESLGQLIARADQQLLATRSTTTATINGKAPRYA